MNVNPDSAFIIISPYLKPPTFQSGVRINKMLTMTYSHMGEPHYHRRYDVSLLSSGRDQVVPSCYCRQRKRINNAVYESVILFFTLNINSLKFFKIDSSLLGKIFTLISY